MNRAFVSRAALLATLFGFTSPVSLAWAQQPWAESHGLHMMWEGGWMLPGLLMMLVFAAVIVAVVVLVFRWLGARNAVQAESSAINILKERYAWGEIDREEFEERTRVVNK